MIGRAVLERRINPSEIIEIEFRNTGRADRQGIYAGFPGGHMRKVEIAGELPKETGNFVKQSTKTSQNKKYFRRKNSNWSRTGEYTNLCSHTKLQLEILRQNLRIPAKN